MLPVCTVASHPASASGFWSGGNAAPHCACMLLNVAPAWAFVKPKYNPTKTPIVLSANVT